MWHRWKYNRTKTLLESVVLCVCVCVCQCKNERGEKQIAERGERQRGRETNEGYREGESREEEGEEMSLE